MRTYDHTLVPGEVIDQEDIMTIPDQVEPISETWERLRRGYEIPIQTPTFNELVSADFRNMDKIERHMFKRGLQQRLDLIEKEFKESQTPEELEELELQNLEAKLEILAQRKARNDGRSGEQASSEAEPKE